MTTEDRFEAFTSPFSFTLSEAVSLFHHEVMLKKDVGKPPSTENVGLIVGVVQINDEIEVLIKFIDELMQLNKRGVKDLLEVITDDH